MAGAGFKTFASGEVLTAANVNTYLMQQTVMVFANSSARSTALGANVSEGMLSYLKDTDKVEVYDGSSWVATGGSGGLTSLATGTLSGGNVAITSIPGTYKHLQLVLTGVSCTSNFNVGIQYNSLTTNTYSTGSVYVDTTSGAALTNDAGTNRWYPVTNTSALAASTNYNAVINFWNYAVSGSMRHFSSNAAIERTDGLERAFLSFGYQEGTGAITSLDILTSAGTFDAGTYTLYGVS